MRVEHPTALTQAAAHWHALQREGDLSPSQQRAFMQWLLVSPDHLREYMAISEVASALGDALRTLPVDVDALLQAPAPAANVHNVVRLSPRSAAAPATRAKHPARGVPRIAVAAALMLAVGLATTVAWPRTAHYVAAHGAPRQITLADSTVVHLDAESEMSVRMSLLGRRVELERGQASFVVGKDRRPFAVHAAGLQVTDIGTTFDVSLLREQARIGVSEGRVHVRGDGGRGRMLADLGAGQAAQVDYRDQQVRISQEDAASMTAWWNGRMVFRDEPLRDVADRFNRRNTLRLHVSDDAGALRLTGNLRADDVASLRAFLDQQPTLVTQHSADGIHVQRRAAPPL
ncbi:iron dicitrate transport regulator FecR [Stenotrophomonas sp. LMG 10879]|uniref:FecR family protein n=1 Tax=Stenotrophomonas sp. LMG 10879 TaxID=487706 RepID=UPI000C18075C|nr:FecR domain-containing protein [Stenotrophomonas sp. LMG 10879]PII20020.1 iron dicitrate transport regulator FecR [Stenotrophomonas sp. LMG 10879]